MGKTVYAVFNGQKETRTQAVYQYDHGRVLAFPDLDLPAEYEVHFGNGPTGNATPVDGGTDGVVIPDDILETPGNKYAWLVFHEGENDGETEYVAVIPVTARAKAVEPEQAQG